MFFERGVEYIAEGWDESVTGLKLYWQWEMDFLMNLQNFRLESGHDFITAIMWFLSIIGNVGAVWIVLSIILAIIPKSRKCGFTMMVAMIITVIIGNVIMKNAFARLRPCWIEESVKMAIKIPDDFSFPSGHTMNGVTASLVILFYTIKEKKAVWAGIISVVFAGLIAFSRMYLFVHWPTDIIAGAIIGAIDAVIAFVVMEKVYAAVCPKIEAKIAAKKAAKKAEN